MTHGEGPRVPGGPGRQRDPESPDGRRVPAGPGAPAAAEGEAAPPGRATRVLIVEDEAINRALLLAVLRSSLGRSRLGPVDVHETQTLAAGRSAVQGARWDVIILDVRLPDGNGLDLLGDLPGPDAGERPYTIVMSASVLPADRDAAHRAGADAFLAKPFLPADLIALLEPAARRGG